jgi:hypothetical protein
MHPPVAACLLAPAGPRASLSRAACHNAPHVTSPEQIDLMANIARKSIEPATCA